MEKKMIADYNPFKEFEITAIQSPLFGKRKTRLAWILLGFLWLGAAPLFAEAAPAKESAFKEIVSIEKRGFVNFLTSPSELVFAFQGEKKAHPKAWPLTYIPRFFSNTATRVGSSVFDIAVLPWYVRQSGDDTPLTRRFDLPDYAWEKE